MPSTPVFSYFQTIEFLKADLIRAETRRLNKIIVEVNHENRQLTKARFDGFMFNGTFYRPDQPVIINAGPGGGVTILHESLEARMHRYQSDKKLVHSETALIGQILFVILDPCTCQQDMRDALPECLVECVEGLNKLSRTNEEAWTIKGNARATAQFQKLLPRMIFYTMARLLY